MARISATSAWTAFMALSLGAGCTSSAGDPDATAGAGGSGGSGGSGASSSAVATTSTTTASGNPAQCNPPAEPGSIYELTAVSYDINQIDPVAMCNYRGEVMLISNTAALWGYTPQYAGLQVLEDQFAGQGLHVMGFLSNDFGNQGGTDGEVDGCVEQYGVTFEQFAIDHVKGADAQPVFSWLSAQPNPGPSTTTEPTWNFHKYLISRQGELVAHWDSAVYPGDNPNDPNDSFETNPIVIAIQEELAK